MDSIESKLKDIISDKMGINKNDIKRESSFIDLGADSLDLVELIMEAENEFNIIITDEDAENIVTLYDALVYLNKKLIPHDELAVNAVVKKNIFISYRREDSEYITGRICDRLVMRFDKDHIFIDVDSIPLGVDFRAFLEDKVSCCAVFLVVIGEYWDGANQKENRRRIDDERDFVRIEIESALKRNIPVIPVLVKGAEMPEEKDLPASIKILAYRNGIQIRPDPDFHRDIDRLIQGIEGYL